MNAPLGNSSLVPTDVVHHECTQGEANAVLHLPLDKELVNLLVQQGMTEQIAAIVCEVLAKHGADHGLSDLKEALLQSQQQPSPKRRLPGYEPLAANGCSPSAVSSPQPGHPSRPVSPVTQSDESDTGRTVVSSCVATSFPVLARPICRRSSSLLGVSRDAESLTNMGYDGHMMQPDHSSPTRGCDGALSDGFAANAVSAFHKYNSTAEIIAKESLRPIIDSPSPVLDISPMKISSLLSNMSEPVTPETNPSKKLMTSQKSTMFVGTPQSKMHPSRNRCEICERAFSRVTDMRRHMKNCHSSSRPFSCACGKNFKRSDILMRHQRTHACRPNASV